MIVYYLICLFAPLPLWLVEQPLPYPYVVEEIFKWIMVKKVNRWQEGMMMGAVFSLSESVFYLANFWAIGNFSLVPARLLLATTMHSLTGGLMALTRKTGWWSATTLGLSMLIHFGYNVILLY